MGLKFDHLPFSTLCVEGAERGDGWSSCSRYLTVFLIKGRSRAHCFCFFTLKHHAAGGEVRQIGQAGKRLEYTCRCEAALHGPVSAMRPKVEFSCG